MRSSRKEPKAIESCVVGKSACAEAYVSYTFVASSWMFLLPGVVDAHQGLDYLNHALRIAHSNRPAKTDVECVALFHAHWPPG